MNFIIMRGIDMSVFADLLGIAKHIFLISSRADKVRKVRQLKDDIKYMETVVTQPWEDKTYVKLQEQVAKLEQDLYDSN